MKMVDTTYLSYPPPEVAANQRRLATAEGLNEEDDVVGAGARIGFTVAVLAAAWGTNALVAGAAVGTEGAAFATGA